MLRAARPRARRAIALGVVAVLAAACATEAGGAPGSSAAAPDQGIDDTAPARQPAVERAPAPTTTSTEPPAPPTTEAQPVDIHALRPPAPADDPESLARQIAAAEATIADAEATEHAVAEAALAQQVAYRRLGDRPDWDEAVLAALPAELHLTARRHAAARREFMAMHTRLSDTLPAWEIMAPVPIDELMGHYLAAQEEFGVRWEHLAAVNLVETGMGRIRGYSSAGARGPMQFMPATWAAFGEGDIDDPADSIRAAARYLAHSGYRDDLDGALFAYNRSNRYVRGVRYYADLMIDDPRAFVGLYHWGIMYRSEHGDVYLPVGFAEPERVAVLDYLGR